MKPSQPAPPFPFQSVSTHHFSVSPCTASHLTSSSSGTTSAHTLRLWQVLSSQQKGKLATGQQESWFLAFRCFPSLLCVPAAKGDSRLAMLLVWQNPWELTEFCCSNFFGLQPIAYSWLFSRRLRERTASPRRSATVSLEIAGWWCQQHMTKMSPDVSITPSLAPTRRQTMDPLWRSRLFSSFQPRKSGGSRAGLKTWALQRSQSQVEIWTPTLPWSIDDYMHWDQHPCTMTTLVSCQDVRK